jgi:response regulator RpfG family c-di-GMP phosphodiesterase
MKRWQQWFGLPDQTIYLQKLMESLLAMAWFVEARDPYTGGHLWRVSRYARLLADAAGLSEVDAARVSLGGFLHDLGKVGVPDAILRKPGTLTSQEYALVQTHPDIGLRMLAEHPLSALVADAISKHHERPDKQGYPYGLAADQIPLDGRIIGICDAFDAMTSRRPYRVGMSANDALAILVSGTGQQFDEYFVEIFVGLGKHHELDAVIRHSDDGIPLQTCPMCGPTLVLKREQADGSLIYCRNCSGEFEVRFNSLHTLSANPTGRKGNAEQLEPELDSTLVSRTVRSMAVIFPLIDLTALPH